MKRQVWFFLLLAYAFTWLVWVTAGMFGVGPDHGEYFAAFGTAGPALAAIFLSRQGQGEITEPLSVRVFSFTILWLFAWAIYVANDKLRGIHVPTSVLYYSVVGLLAMIPAWILSGAFTRDPGVRKSIDTLVHPGNWRWQAISFFFWPAVLLIPAGIARVFHGQLVMPEPHGVGWMSAAFGGIYFLNNFLFTAALEEPGWRGYLLPQLQQRFSPLLASLLVWLPWALWHAPLDFHRPFRFALVQYLLIRVVFLIPISIILTWFYNRSGANVLTVAIFHAAMNTFPFVLPYYAPAMGLVILFAGIIVVADRMWLRRTILADLSATDRDTSQSSQSVSG